MHRSPDKPNRASTYALVVLLVFVSNYGYSFYCAGHHGYQEHALSVSSKIITESFSDKSLQTEKTTHLVTDVTVFKMLFRHRSIRKLRSGKILLTIIERNNYYSHITINAP